MEPEKSYRIYFVQNFPLLIRHSQSLCSLNGSFHLACPYFQIFNVLLINEPRQAPGKLQNTAEGKMKVTAEGTPAEAL